jgi:hypothetical protein
MKYMLLVQLGDTPRPRRDGDGDERAVAAWERLPEEERKAIGAAYQAINQTPGASPGFQLQPADMATTVRVRGGETLVTDGPFVAVKEALGGYYFFEAHDLAAAVELAARVPAARMGGAVEVRPLVER